MSFKRVTAELDEIAGQLQKKGLNRMAASVDVVANTLEELSKSRRASKKRQADQSMGMSFPGSSGGMSANPGSEDADEDGRSDAYTAPQEIMHRVPVGKDSMLRATRGVASPGEISLDFAQEEQQISIQAGKRRRSKKNRRRATPRGNEGWLDPGNPDDIKSTAGLPETGDEDEVPPVDKPQVGDVLPFYGTDPAGSLHGGGRASNRSNGNMTSQAQNARFALLREAAEVNVQMKHPNDIESDDPGDDVESDQSLGGLPTESGDSSVVSMPMEMGAGAIDEAGIVGAEEDDDYDDDEMDDEDEDDYEDDEDDYEDDDEEMDDDYDDEDDYDDDDDDDDYDDDDDMEDEESAGAYAAIEYP